MNKWGWVILVVIFCLAKVGVSQFINDIIKIEGEYYVISPSPSFSYSYDNTFYCKDKTIYRGEYELKNNKLIFVNLLGLNNSIKKSDLSFLELPSSDQHIKVTGKFKIYKVDEIDRVRKILNHRAAETSSSRSRNSAELDFVKGEIKELYYLQDSVESFNDYGILSYYRYNRDTSDVNVIRIKDSLVVHSFENRKVIPNKAPMARGGRYGSIGYSPANYKHTCRLPQGEYFLSKYEDSLLVSDTCQIIVGCTTEINFNIKNPKAVKIRKDTAQLRLIDYEGLGLDFDYGNNQIDNPSQHQINMFGFSIYHTREHFLGIRNQFSIIGSTGGRFAYGLIHPDSSVIGMRDFTFQNYSYLSFLVSGSARLYLTKYKSKSQTRMYLETGVRYDLPILFRYIARNGGDKFSSKWIHQLTDVSLFGKIGFHKGIAIKAGFRPFNVMKRPYPQLAKFNVGLSYSYYF